MSDLFSSVMDWLGMTSFDTLHIHVRTYGVSNFGFIWTKSILVNSSQIIMCISYTSSQCITYHTWFYFILNSASLRLSISTKKFSKIKFIFSEDGSVNKFFFSEDGMKINSFFLRVSVNKFFFSDDGL